MTAVVSDSSPLNYLALLGDFELLRRLYKKLVIPPAVHREVVLQGSPYPVHGAVVAALGKWISLAETSDPEKVAALRAEFGLDWGESQAILVAERLDHASLLMDERRGVRCARSRGLAVTRTPMIYASAKILGMIESVAPKLDQLRRAGFRLSDEHCRLILNEVGEL